MLIAEELEARRAEIESAPSLRALLDALGRRNARVIAEAPPVPDAKALLSVDGGRCEECGGALHFDPWSPRVHRCAVCGRSHGGERHDRAWARWQHLWLAERAAELATLAVMTGDEAAAERARAILAAYGERYLEYPNVDNVLGPARLFFSTYLESVWLTGFLAAAHLLREAGLLDEATQDGVNRVADEAANLIGEFDEGFSNRQTWHAAALAAAAVWFEDEELAAGAIQGETGLLAHLLRGFGEDGLWYEGENYHLFALRGLLTGLGWARLAGVDPFSEEPLAARIAAALRAPALTALPDATFPARRDARFAVSLAQPMYLELWEVGLARLADAGADVAGLEDWLARLRAVPPPPPERFDSWLHHAGAAETGDAPRLSWWALLTMRPDLGGDAAQWQPGSVLLEDQGLAVLRAGGRYASLECGVSGGGHGHPDRLHLTLHQDGVHWLPDPGTGSYVARDLFWYRSTLAHNAPRLDGSSQAPGDAVCAAFDQDGGWVWVQGTFGRMRRTVVSGPSYLLDVVELDGQDRHVAELPWHFDGDLAVAGEHEWLPLPDERLGEPEFVREVERLGAVSRDTVVDIAARHGTAELRATMLGAAELLRATAPGVPGGPRRSFLVARDTGTYARFITVLAPAGGARLVNVVGDVIEIAAPEGTERHQPAVDGWRIDSSSGAVALGGRRPAPRRHEPLVTRQRPLVVSTRAPWVDERPALDGTLRGFDTSDPIDLDHEDQYRRSEEPYAGPDEFSATAWVNWDDAGLYVAVEVRTADVVIRAPDAPPLLLDNEPDAIHSAGVQVYVRAVENPGFVGVLATPVPGGTDIRVSSVGGTGTGAGVGAGAGTDIASAAKGAWQRTPDGYRMTLAIEPPDWSLWYAGDTVGFDLVVNEMRPGRERRSGQLVWSGGGGWVWLRGDRHDPARLGTLVLRER